MAKSSVPQISVVVPAYNEEGFLGKCLESLVNQALDKKHYEVIVVDNASSDRTSEIAKKYPFKLIYEPKRSVVIARQAGVDKSKGKIIVSADADTVYPSNWLTKIKEDFEKYPDIMGIVGWIYFTSSPTLFNILFALEQEANLFLSRTTGKFPLIFAANFAFRRWALDKIGGYPDYLPELGDQQYLLFLLRKLGPIIVDKRIFCFTSSRRHNNLWKTILLDDGWHRLMGYSVNKIFGKQIIGPAPAIRLVQPQKSRFFRKAP